MARIEDCSEGLGPDDMGPPAKRTNEAEYFARAANLANDSNPPTPPKVWAHQLEHRGQGVTSSAGCTRYDAVANESDYCVTRRICDERNASISSVLNHVMKIVPCLQALVIRGNNAPQRLAPNRWCRSALSWNACLRSRSECNDWSAAPRQSPASALPPSCARSHQA